ncbi:hypothetical protein R3I94_006234 [Phoxinus phoxinus]
MVSSVHLSVLLGIILLSCRPIQSRKNKGVNSNTLSRIQNFFRRNYSNNGQYAVAINVPRWQCQSGFVPETNNFLTHDPSAAVKPFTRRDSMNVYNEGNQLIAAGVHKDAHSEYLLMYPQPGSTTSPLTDLLNHKSNRCVIFYTLLSPCIDRCINNDIIAGLDELKAYQGIKAFVFTHIYKKDKADPTKLGTELKKIADRVSLYRCFTGRNTGCVLCGKPGSNTAVNNQCLTE